MSESGYVRKTPLKYAQEHTTSILLVKESASILRPSTLRIVNLCLSLETHPKTPLSPIFDGILKNVKTIPSAWTPRYHSRYHEMRAIIFFTFQVHQSLRFRLRFMVLNVFWKSSDTSKLCHFERYPA
jgi:hypothetical protein